MNNTPLHLETERLILRMGTPNDASTIVRFYSENRSHLTPWWPLWTADFFTEARWRNRIVQDAQEFASDISVHLFLFPKEEPERVVGMCNLNSITRGVAQYCSMGYGLDYREEGKGLMTEAVREVIRYGFAEKHLHRIQANYIPHNQRSGALLRRLGFVVEGYARDFLFINGKWEDHILTSLINPDWARPTG